MYLPHIAISLRRGQLVYNSLLRFFVQIFGSYIHAKFIILCVLCVLCVRLEKLFKLFELFSVLGYPPFQPTLEVHPQQPVRPARQPRPHWAIVTHPRLTVPVD